MKKNWKKKRNGKIGAPQCGLWHFNLSAKKKERIGNKCKEELQYGLWHFSLSVKKNKKTSWNYGGTPVWTKNYNSFLWNRQNEIGSEIFFPSTLLRNDKWKKRGIPVRVEVVVLRVNISYCVQFLCVQNMWNRVCILQRNHIERARIAQSRKTRGSPCL